MAAGTARFAATMRPGSVGKMRDGTGIPLNLTIGWLVRKGKPLCQHDERLIQRFIEGWC